MLIATTFVARSPLLLLLLPPDVAAAAAAPPIRKFFHSNLNLQSSQRSPRRRARSPAAATGGEGGGRNLQRTIAPFCFKSLFAVRAWSSEGDRAFGPSLEHTPRRDAPHSKYAKAIIKWSPGGINFCPRKSYAKTAI